MTKYDLVFNSPKTSEESLSPEEAVAAIATVTVIADSSIDDVDAESLAGILWEFEVFEEYSEDEIAEIVDRLIGIAEEEGIGPLFNTAKVSLSDELVLDGFAAGVIVLLDDELAIPKPKQAYLKKLQAALELEDEEAEEIIKEVVAAFKETEEEYADDEDADDEDTDDEDETVVIEDFTQQTYQSPLGNFTVQIPVDPQQGGRIQSQEGVVGFSDDIGTLLRIDYYPFPLEQLEELESVGQEEYLQTILVDKYVPQAIFVNVPDASVEYSEYLKDTLRGAYYVLIDMPKGSTISKQENNGTAIRLDAYRGLLTFISGEFLYIVSSQHSFINGETPDSLEEEAEDIKESILEFIETIEFN